MVVEASEYVPTFIIVKMSNLDGYSIFASNTIPILDSKPPQSHSHTSQELEFTKLLACLYFIRSTPSIAFISLGPMSSNLFDQNLGTNPSPYVEILLKHYQQYR